MIEKEIKRVKRRIKIIKFFAPKSWHKDIIIYLKKEIINKFGLEIGNAIFYELKGDKND